MPKNIFKKLLPHMDKFKKDPNISFALGNSLNEPRLWSINRSSLSKGVFIGIFCSFLPLPFQMFIAALAALYFKANLPLSVSLVWISNPLTMLPILYTSYYIGSLLLGTPINPLNLSSDFSWLWNDFSAYWQPLLLGTLICGSVTAFLGYWIIQLVWRWSIARSWKQRTLRRQKKLSEQKED